jgi:hypothetical protein
VAFLEHEPLDAEIALASVLSVMAGGVLVVTLRPSPMRPRQPKVERRGSKGFRTLT